MLYLTDKEINNMEAAQSWRQVKAKMALRQWAQNMKNNKINKILKKSYQENKNVTWQKDY